MNDKPTDDQPVQGEVNKQTPDQGKEPARKGGKPTGGEKAGDREGQTREPGYDEA
ncbi:hypothetical protein [Azospirillum sp. B506]|uniref:hypothetical protein n=1 Tax=Azospirillum sp. B506 TaxID=137721 RepID=UPI000349000F|nr:hypothetical protein [Azospirillum sp. B506]